MQLEPTLVIFAVAGGRRKFPLLSETIKVLDKKNKKRGRDHSLACGNTKGAK
jgi:hypothetical protein